MKLVTRFAFTIVTTLAAAGCSTKKTEENKEAVPRPADEPRPADPAKAAEPAPAAANAKPAPPTDIPADFAPECVVYAALIDKLKACDKLAGARDGLTQGYNTLRSAWSMIPADRRADTAAQCKAQADSLRDAAAATCGW